VQPLRGYNRSGFASDGRCLGRIPFDVLRGKLVDVRELRGPRSRLLEECSKP
jgi:hypothetical protein